jgi:tetratricopeptide (TPR) repeat protein
MDSLDRLHELLCRFREAGDDHQVANLAFRLGDVYREKGRFDEALPLLEEAYTICRKLENETGEAIVALSLTELHLAAGHPEQAEILARRAYRICAKADDRKGRARACLLLGDSHWARQNPREALPRYREAFELCSTSDDVLGSAVLLDRIAKMHRILEEDDKAFTHFQEALLRWEKLCLPDRMAMTYANLGDLCKKKGAVEEAIRFHRQALELYRQMKDARAVQAIEAELSTLEPAGVPDTPPPAGEQP